MKPQNLATSHGEVSICFKFLKRDSGYGLARWQFSKSNQKYVTIYQADFSDFHHFLSPGGPPTLAPFPQYVGVRGSAHTLMTRMLLQVALAFKLALRKYMIKMLSFPSQYLTGEPVEGEEVQGKGFATAGPPNSRKGVGFRRSRHVSTSWMLDSGSPDPPVPEPLANFSLSTSCSTWALPLLKGKVAAR